MRIIFKVLLNLLLLSYVLGFLHCESWEVLVPHPGMELPPATLESGVWTTGLPGKSHNRNILNIKLFNICIQVLADLLYFF